MTESSSLPATARLGVVLLNLGGPTSRQAVKPFLYNLFADPDIIKLGGGGFQRWLARTISSRRAPIVGEKYAQINACPTGCQGHALCPNHVNGTVSDACSPLNPLTERQRQGLEALLQQQLPHLWVRVYSAMRYWHPTTPQTLQQMQADGVTHVVLLPLYPQFSYTTTGSSFREWAQLVPQPTWQEYQVKDYATDPYFIQAVNERIDEALHGLPAQARGQAHLVFSAHGTPLAEVRAGDPYTEQVRQTVAAVMARRTPAEPHWLAFQSRVGPAKWTQPNTEALVLRLLDYGIRHLVLVPIAFVTDHIETLMELDRELREAAHGRTIGSLTVTRGLNDHPAFLQALAQQVYARLCLTPTPHTLPEPEVVMA